MRIINARGNTFNMDEILRSGVHYNFYETDYESLGTPYNKGVTDSTAGIILSYSNSPKVEGQGAYGSQFAFLSANVIYVRTMVADNDNGTSKISDWVKVPTETDLTSNYLPRQGGTMTGPLYIDNDGASRLGVMDTTQWDTYTSHWRKTNKSGFSLHVSTNDTDTVPSMSTVGIKYHDENDNWGNLYSLYGTHNVTKSTTDLTSGSSALTTDKIYLVYE